MCADLCFYPQIHKRIPGRYADAKPPILPGEGSKQSQVSALPERRVKKQRLTALLGSYEHLRMLIFYGISGICVGIQSLTVLNEYAILISEPERLFDMLVGRLLRMRGWLYSAVKGCLAWLTDC